MAEHKPFERYLQEVRAHLGGLSPEQRERVLRELQQHLDDAAHHASADPRDPLFQAGLIDRLGSSRQLGHALARAHRSPAEQQRLVGGVAALFSVLLVLAAWPVSVTLQDYRLFMNMVTAAPVAVIPTMLVLHMIYRPLRPRMSWWALGCGMLGQVTLGIWTVYPDILELMGLLDTVLLRPIDALNANPLISMPLLGLVGVWFILIGRLSWTTRTPATPAFGWESMLTGGFFLAFLLGIMIYHIIAWVGGTVPPLVTSTIGSLMSLIGIAWVFCHLAWAGIAAMWLLQRRAPPPAQVA
jgi:hypothetical protein